MSDLKEVEGDAKETNSVTEAVSQEGSQATDSPARKSSKGIYAILVLLLIGGAALISPDQFKSMFHVAREWMAPTPIKLPAEVVAPRPATVLPPPVAPKPVLKAPEPRVVPTPIKQPARPSVSSKEIEQLLGRIEGLSSELVRMEEDQRVLRAALNEQQQMNLQVRLRWIMDPSARLPQIQLAWEEISLLPGLSDEQRDIAVRMHALARSNSERLQQWQIAIRKWVDTLAVPVHQDIIPHPEHPWLAWIVGQFHLREAPSVEARKLIRLREQLLDAAGLLKLESWPEPGAWQSLRAKLLLQIKAGKGDSEAPVELGLPDDFSAIQQDILTLRNTARGWLEQR